MVIVSFPSTKIPILYFEFQAWFSFFSKNFSVWWISGRSYFFFTHKSAKKIKKKEEEEEVEDENWMNEVKDENFKHSAFMALNCF